MTGWLLDTNILSELRRTAPDPKVRAFVAQQPLESLHVSVVTFAELRFGIERLPESDRRTLLADWLTHTVRPMFASRMLPLTEDIVATCRFMVEAGRRVGRTFSQPDLFIGATASRHELTVVSRDVGEFRRAAVAALNPWVETLPS